mmetsp:Transcript_132972/g.384497  ORF Transcript_132972/g.384497 Transcript_132972/m.384497 type:complete len:209 (-) Transcript_132972:116-742(-)
MARACDAVTFYIYGGVLAAAAFLLAIFFHQTCPYSKECGTAGSFMVLISVVSFFQMCVMLTIGKALSGISQMHVRDLTPSTMAWSVKRRGNVAKSGPVCSRVLLLMNVLFAGAGMALGVSQCPSRPERNVPNGWKDYCSSPIRVPQPTQDFGVLVGLTWAICFFGCCAKVGGAGKTPPYLYDPMPEVGGDDLTTVLGAVRQLTRCCHP